MKSSLFFGAVGVLAVAQGCVTGFSATEGSTSNGGAGPSSSAVSMDVSATSSATGTGGATTAMTATASSSTGVATTCPDLRGAYTIGATGTSGCGTLNPVTIQCIKAPGSPCSANFVSKTNLMAGGGIDGPVTLDDKGDFKGAALTEADVPRTGCTGTWTASSKVMTVTCGGMGSGQSCTLTLTHSGDCLL